MAAATVIVGGVRQQGTLLVGGILAVAILGALVTLGFVPYVLDQRDEIVHTYESAVYEALATDQLVLASEQSATLVHSYLIAPAPDTLEELGRRRAALDQRLAAMRARTTTAEELALLEEAGHRLLAMRAAGDQLITARSAGEPLDSVRRRFDAELQPARRSLDATLHEYAALKDAQIMRAQELGEVMTASTTRKLAAAVLLALLALLTFAGLLARTSARRRDSELTLRTSEAKLAAMVNTAADAIITVDREQRITMFNDGATKIFGYARDEILGKPLEVLIPERLRGRHGAHVRAFGGGPSASRRMGERTGIAGLRKSGEEFPADAAISRVAVDDELVLTVVLRDITAQQRREDEQRLLAAAGSSLAAALDEEAVVAAALVQVCEYGDACLLVLVDDGVVRKVCALASDTRLGEALEAHERRSTRFTKAVLDENGSRTFSSSELGAELSQLGITAAAAEPLYGSGGRLLGVLVCAGVGRPLRLADAYTRSELARLVGLSLANAQLHRGEREAIALREHVLSVVAHDLRNPLNAMRLNADIVRRRLERQGGQDLSPVHAIFDSADRMNRLIEDLLDVARLQGGTLRITREAVDPAALVREAFTLFEPLAAGRLLEVVVAEGLPPVSADRQRVLQIMGNLVGNALKFTPEGGRVVLSAERDGSYVRFAITDDGPGLAPADIPKLFERFWQGRRGDKRGAGLGLSIAKTLVESHGGRISVHSEPERGATFAFTLPLSPAGAGGDNQS